MKTMCAKGVGRFGNALIALSLFRVQFNLKKNHVLSQFQGEFFQEAPFEPAATVATAVTTRALKPLSLGQLLVLITRHGELSKVIAK